MRPSCLFHGGPDGGGEEFSVTDKDDYINYVDTPSGEILKYDPDDPNNIVIVSGECP
jgi:hypothetical protein